MASLICTFLSFANLSVEEKVGQLLMTSVFVDQADDELDPYLKEFKPGHLIFVGNGWDPEREKALIKRYQSLSIYHLTIAQDLEWGLSMRMKNVPIFPKNNELSKLSNTEIFNIGKKIGQQCQEIGVTLNLAPVVDVWNNPNNGFLKERSFGPDADLVARCGKAMMLGLQAGGVKTCAKHFPGHGNTSSDSHYDLPVLVQTLNDLRKIELIPFKTLIDAKVDCVMTAHLALPNIDPDALAATLSPLMIETVLKNELGFKGIVITDDLLMKAISDRMSYGEAAIKAFKAGNDILLFTHYTPGNPSVVRSALKEAHTALVQAVKSGDISTTKLDEAVKKIFLFKGVTLFSG